jgi:hypothetical protein
LFFQCATARFVLSDGDADDAAVFGEGEETGDFGLRNIGEPGHFALAEAINVVKARD